MKKNGHKPIKDLQKNQPFDLSADRTTKIIESLVEGLQDGIDYDVVIKGKKPVLLICGANKLLCRFNLRADFELDKDTMAAYAHIKGILALKCKLIDRNTDKEIGSGVGVSVLGEKENCKDPNSARKMAEIRAMRGAVLNVFPIRHRFTQDLEDAVIQETKINVDGEGNVSL